MIELERLEIAVIEREKLAKLVTQLQIVAWVKLQELEERLDGK